MIYNTRKDVKVYPSRKKLIMLIIIYTWWRWWWLYSFHKQSRMHPVMIGLNSFYKISTFCQLFFSGWSWWHVVLAICRFLHGSVARRSPAVLEQVPSVGVAAAVCRHQPIGRQLHLLLWVWHHGGTALQYDVAGLHASRRGGRTYLVQQHPESQVAWWETMKVYIKPK